MARLDPSERIRDADRTRADLLAVATQMFAEQGYSGARVDEIAERTRTTKRMIYYYFGGKEGLYLAALEAAYRNIREAEQAINAGDLPPVEAIRRIAELSFDHHHAHPDFVRLVATENIHQAEHLRKVESLRDLNAPVVSLLDGVLVRGVDEGEFRNDVDAVDVHVLITSYCVFQVDHAATFGFLFGRDMLAPEVRETHRRMLGDIVVGWLTQR